MIKQKEAETIAVTYAKAIGIGPFVVDGSELDNAEGKPIWRVFLGFVFDSISPGMIVDVDAATGEASHIQSL
jgi:hypothetical protein